MPCAVSAGMHPVQKCPVLLFINLYSRSPNNALYLKNIYVPYYSLVCSLLCSTNFCHNNPISAIYTERDASYTWEQMFKRSMIYMYIIGKYCLIKTLIIILPWALWMAYLPTIPRRTYTWSRKLISASDTIINGYLPCNGQCLRKGMEESRASYKYRINLKGPVILSIRLSFC